MCEDPVSSLLGGLFCLPVCLEEGDQDVVALDHRVRVTQTQLKTKSIILINSLKVANALLPFEDSVLMPQL